MVLTLRPTGLSSDPNRQDWSIHENGNEVGRLYEDLQSTDPENRWYWSITLMGPARSSCQCEGRAPTLEHAEASFRNALERFKAANKSS